jgi:hypothetical protein
MPQTTQKIFSQMLLPYPATCHDALETAENGEGAFVWTLDLPAGHQMGAAEHLFVKIQDDVIADYKMRFGDQDEKLRARPKCALQMVAGRVMGVADHPTLGETHFLLQVQCVSDAEAKKISAAADAAAAAAAAAATAAANSSTSSPQPDPAANSEPAEGAAEITAQGLVVRNLKSDKDTPKEEIKAAIDELLRLKKLYPAAAAPKKKKENKGKKGGGGKKKKEKTVLAVRQLVMEKHGYSADSLGDKILVLVINTKTTYLKKQKNEGVLLMARDKASATKVLLTGDFKAGEKLLPLGYDFEESKGLDVRRGVNKLALHQATDGRVVDGSDNALCLNGLEGARAARVDFQALDGKNFVVTV